MAEIPRPSTRVLLLGTAAGPSLKPGRNPTASAVLRGDRTYVVDCGNGVGLQLARAGVAPGSLRAILLTHHHIDHVADFGVLITQSWSQLETPVTLVGPPPLARMLALFLELYSVDLAGRVAEEGRRPLAELILVREITGDGPVYEEEGLRICCASVRHPPLEHAYAYRFEANDRTIVFSGDTALHLPLAEFARGADTLVHEAVYLPALEAEFPAARAARLRARLQSAHSSVEDAARIAAAAGVRRLVLSPVTPSRGVDEATWLAAAAAHFDGEVILGHDLLEV
jgi:ribonuclease BN (tRNA processing enzyme)